MEGGASSASGAVPEAAAVPEPEAARVPEEMRVQLEQDALMDSAVADGVEVSVAERVEVDSEVPAARTADDVEAPPAGLVLDHAPLGASSEAMEDMDDDIGLVDVPQRAEPLEEGEVGGDAHAHAAVHLADAGA